MVILKRASGGFELADSGLRVGGTLTRITVADWVLGRAGLELCEQSSRP